MRYTSLLARRWHGFSARFTTRKTIRWKCRTRWPQQIAMSSVMKSRCRTTGMEIAENRPLRVGACLSLSGRFARFGTQGAQGLKVWKSLDGQADVVLEDDKSDPHTLEDILPRLASECDLLLGPYSTQLTRSAARIASGLDLLLWKIG